MQIELPADIVHRLRLRTNAELSETDVIRAAMDALDRLDEERAAIQVGIDAMHAGDMEEWEDFDREFRCNNGIDPSAT